MMAIGGEAEARPTVVALLSGGLDSMVAAGLMRERGFRIVGLTIDYNQRHRREIEHARLVAAAIGCERHVVLPLDLSAFGGSALTSNIAVPKSGVGEGIPVTYVPARNLVFLSLTLAWAEAIEARDMVIGVNALDYSGYPDCRAEFINGFEELAKLATKAGTDGHAVRVNAPLQFMTKAEIVQEAYRLELDPGMTWSCYDPAADGTACGECDSCRLRREGFGQAGRVDPAKYAV